MTPYIRPICGCIALLWIGGCESQSSKGTAPDAITITIPPFEVPPGKEVQNCHYMKAPNDTDIDIGRAKLDFSKGTHHAHLYTSETPHDDGIEECFMAVDFDQWHLLVATQREQLDWELPPGTGIRLKAHQQLLVQVHYTNASLLVTDQNIGQGTFTLERRPSSEVTQHIGTTFGQQRTIHIPPHSTFAVEGLCQLPRPVQIAAFAGHYHFRGQDFIGYKTDPTGQREDEFYRTSDFAEPKFNIYTPDNPLSFAGNERILWRCDYDNNTDLDIMFGPHEVDQEHCNMFVFYYPAASEQEFTPCVSWQRCNQQCADGQTCSTAGTCVNQ